MRVLVRVSLCAVLALALFSAGLMTVQAQAPAAPETLTKPLNQFTIGDIFPKVAGESFRQTGKEWQSAADDFLKRSNERKAALGQAIPAKEAEIKKLKDELKVANKDKDFTKAGTLEGQVKTESIVAAVLGQLDKVNESQAAAATAWSQVGTAMQRFVDADEKFDQYRATGIARPQDGSTAKRLSAEGYNTILQQAESMEDLAEAFGNVAAQLNGLAGKRKALLSSLAKGGHVEKP